MSPVLSGGTMSIPICETIAGAPRRLFTVALAQLVRGHYDVGRSGHG
jgi:hypothetical protein